jgi:hypothetical protein
MFWWFRRLLGIASLGLFWKIEDYFIIRRSRRLAREDLANPVTVSHPRLGELLLQRQQGWYSRDLEWGGKPVRLTLKGGGELPAQLEDAAAFFARAEEMRRSILACAIARLPELVSGWRLTGDAVAAIAALNLSDELWFVGDGSFDANFTHPDDDRIPMWISVWGNVESGPEDAMIEA